MLNAHAFLNSFFNQVKDIGLDVSGLVLDHIAYQASSFKDYEKRKSDFVKLGRIVNQEIIGGRRVAVFELDEPISYKDYEISVLELIEPKARQVVKSGLQHAEFVYKNSFKKLIKQYPKIDWDTSSLDRKEFAHLKINFDNGLTLKFLHAPILKMITKR